MKIREREDSALKPGDDLIGSYQFPTGYNISAIRQFDPQAPDYSLTRIAKDGLWEIYIRSKTDPSLNKIKPFIDGVMYDGIITGISSAQINQIMDMLSKVK